MNYELMSNDELINQQVGEPISLTAIMAILCVAVMAVVVYKLFFSSKGTAQVPGGWKFTWN